MGRAAVKATAPPSAWPRRARHGIIVAVVTIAAGVLSYWIAEGLLAMLEGLSPMRAPAAFGWLAAFFGFWFAYTGRLARFFRKV